jgi:hypothetical protein
MAPAFAHFVFLTLPTRYHTFPEILDPQTTFCFDTVVYRPAFLHAVPATTAALRPFSAPLSVPVPHAATMIDIERNATTTRVFMVKRDMPTPLGTAPMNLRKR